MLIHLLIGLTIAKVVIIDDIGIKDKIIERKNTKRVNIKEDGKKDVSIPKDYIGNRSREQSFLEKKISMKNKYPIEDIDDEIIDNSENAYLPKGNENHIRKYNKLRKNDTKSDVFDIIDEPMQSNTFLKKKDDAETYIFPKRVNFFRKEDENRKNNIRYRQNNISDKFERQNDTLIDNDLYIRNDVPHNYIDRNEMVDNLTKSRYPIERDNPKNIRDFIKRDNVMDRSIERKNHYKDDNITNKFIESNKIEDTNPMNQENNYEFNDYKNKKDIFADSRPTKSDEWNQKWNRDKREQVNIGEPLIVTTNAINMASSTLYNSTNSYNTHEKNTTTYNSSYSYNTPPVSLSSNNIQSVSSTSYNILSSIMPSYTESAINVSNILSAGPNLEVSQLLAEIDNPSHSNISPTVNLPYSGNEENDLIRKEKENLVDAHRARISYLNLKLAASHRSADELTRKAKELQSHMEEIASTLNDRKSTWKEIEATIESRRNHLKNARNNKRAVERDRDKIQSKLRLTNNEIGKLNKKLDDLKAQLETIQEEERVYNGRVDFFEADISEAGKDIVREEAKRAEYLKEIAGLEQAYNNTKNKLEDIKAKVTRENGHQSQIEMAKERLSREEYMM
ncbi:hypothetical protein TCON_2576 [Astathelohania contejeani]|uniref:Uncharacterized protein n=1 Tax=Astathelohania contejeani TaxID=164912 RepID=A0ABQ7HVL9_9MICR|nr:hypothetical protein TCON_2576 [Thelohania contejeani]